MDHHDRTVEAAGTRHAVHAQNMAGSKQITNAQGDLLISSGNKGLELLGICRKVRHPLGDAFVDLVGALVVRAVPRRHNLKLRIGPHVLQRPIIQMQRPIIQMQRSIIQRERQRERAREREKDTGSSKWKKKLDECNVQTSTCAS